MKTADKQEVRDVALTPIENNWDYCWTIFAKETYWLYGNWTG
jgi:hypothetical protein